MLCRTLLICLISGALASHAAPSSSSVLALQQRLVDVFDQAKDSVVRVKAAFAESEVEGSTNILLRVGSGFFISQEGHVLVNASRAAGADRIWVEYRGKSYAAEALGHDRMTNISLLKVLQPPEDFSIISIDGSVPYPKLGTIAIAIACPLEFQPTPSMGIFAGRDKKLGNQVFPTEYIRTSISVEAGQGGCPIMDINGRFVGMAVASVPDLNASYCLPADALAKVRDDLLFSGRIIHGWMGFEVSERLNTDHEHAVYLSKVVDAAPASDAGLQEGDHLISIEGRAINDVTDVPGAIFFTRANQYATITVRRDEENLDFSVKALPREERFDVIDSTEFSRAISESDKAQEVAQ